jgi:hypothetical protein
MKKHNLKERINVYEAYGWYGAVVIVLAYILVSVRAIDAHGFWFHFLNATGAVGIVIVSLRKRNYQPVVINAFRAATGFGALLALLLNSVQ